VADGSAKYQPGVLAAKRGLRSHDAAMSYVIALLDRGNPSLGRWAKPT
jgi:hypothetical protein